jgi:hypothetical protein
LVFIGLFVGFDQMKISGSFIQDTLSSLDFVDKIITATGPRLTGTKATKIASEMIAEEFAKTCDTSVIEKFKVRPKSFLGFIKISVGLYVLSTILLFFNFAVWAAVGFILAVFVMISQFLLYWELFDPLYKQKTGYNVIGTIDPPGEVKQQIIVAGHHDSAYEFRFLSRMPRLYSIRILIAFISIGFSIIFSIWWAIVKISSGENPLFADVFRIALVISFIYIIPLYFFIKNKGTPGAGDNLIASGIAKVMGDIFGGMKQKGSPLLKNTRLIVISFDAEEAGLRGSRRYVKKHLKELTEIPTYVVNIDSIYNADLINFVNLDINSTIRLSESMVKDLKEVSANLGYSTGVVAVPPGGGGTDAASFAQKGIEATTIIAMPLDLVRNVVAYHTQKDTIDSIEPEAVARVLNICYNYIVQKDANIVD